MLKYSEVTHTKQAVGRLAALLSAHLCCWGARSCRTHPVRPRLLRIAAATRLPPSRPPTRSDLLRQRRLNWRTAAPARLKPAGSQLGYY